MAPLARPSRKRTPSSRLEDPTTLVFSAGQVSSSGGGARRHRKDSRQQNSYHPPVGRVMTKDELSEWRAAERKKRNRLAAAASRNKLRQKVRESWPVTYHCYPRLIRRLIIFLHRPPPPSPAPPQWPRGLASPSSMPLPSSTRIAPTALSLSTAPLWTRWTP